MSSAKRDHTASILWAKVIQWPDDAYTAFFVMNHCGSDGASMFSFVDAFLVALGTDSPARQSRPFLNVFNSYDTSAALQKPNAYQTPVNLLQACTSSDQLPVEDSNRAPVGGTWSELDVDTTTALLSNCRAQGATIQAAVSIASLIAVLALKKVQLPQDTVHLIPINMRSRMVPPLAKDEITNASSVIWWSQNIGENETIWDAVKEARQHIAKQVENQAGLKVWSELNAHINAPIPHTLLASSIGSTDLKEHYGNVHLLDVRFFGSSYASIPPGMGSHITHVHTTLGKMHTTNAYAANQFSREWAEEFTRHQQEVLKFLAQPIQGGASDKTVAEFLAKSR